MGAPRLRLALAGFSLLLAACGGREADEADAPAPAVTAPAAQHPYGFQVWHADFPGAPDAPHLSPPHTGTYDRTRRQALESVAAKLQGNCSRDAWLFAKDLFGRVAPADTDVLVLALDRALQVPALADHAENVVEAMGRAATPQLAPALLRALEHPRQAIRDKAMQSLVGSGDAESVRQARAYFDAVDGAGREAWLHAARVHLPPAEAVSIYQGLLADPRQRGAAEMVVRQAERMDPAVAVTVFEPWVGREPPGARLTIAGLRHAAGDSAGSTIIREALHAAEPHTRIQGLQALRYGGPRKLLDDVLALVIDPDAQVRAAVMDTLANVPGEEVDAVLESLSQDESLPVRRQALRLLRIRGRVAVLDDIVASMQTTTGTRLRLAMEDMVAAGYGGAVPVMVSRMEAAPDDEKREYLRAIALTASPECFLPLRDAFLSSVDWAARDVEFYAYLLSNCRGAEDSIIALFRELPRSDYRRRGLLMRTLANIASDRDDQALATRIHAALHEVLIDGAEIPQLRLAALESLRRALTIDDAVAIRRMLRDQEPPMRNALSDFLWEFF